MENDGAGRSDGHAASIERRLQGRTLQVYLYLQRKREPSGIREVQRDLGLSSPSVAEYQVEKLVEMGLASRDGHGRVSCTGNKVRVKALSPYVSFGRFMVPRLAFYATVFSAIAALYASFSFGGGAASLYGVAVPASAAAVFWLEAWKIWKHFCCEGQPQGVAAKGRQGSAAADDHFWASLMPGMAAVAVFAAAIVFLFYYVEPNGLVSGTVPAADPYGQSPFHYYYYYYHYQQGIGDSSSGSTIDDLVRMSGEKIRAVKESGGAGTLFLEPSPAMLAAMSFAGALVVGFVAYLLVKYRCARQDGAGGVLIPEQA